MSLLSVIGFMIFFSVLHFESGNCTQDQGGKCYKEQKGEMCALFKIGEQKAPINVLAVYPDSCIGLLNGIPGRCNPYKKDTGACNNTCLPTCACKKTANGTIMVRRFTSAQDQKYAFGQANRNADGTPKNDNYMNLPISYCNEHNINDWVIRNDCVQCKNVIYK